MEEMAQGMPPTGVRGKRLAEWRLQIVWWWAEREMGGTNSSIGPMPTSLLTAMPGPSMSPRPCQHKRALERLGTLIFKYVHVDTNIYF